MEKAKNHSFDWNYLCYFFLSLIYVTLNFRYLKIKEVPSFLKPISGEELLLFQLSSVSFSLVCIILLASKNGIQNKIIFDSSSSSWSFSSTEQFCDSERRKPLQVLHLDCDLWRYLPSWRPSTGTKYTTIDSTHLQSKIHFFNGQYPLKNSLLMSCLFVCLFKVILINGQFPGPKLEVVTNDNIILNLINKLDQPFLLTW